MIGSLRPSVPELVLDSDSEGGTPLVTPIHTSFGNISNTAGATEISVGLDKFIYAGCNRLDKRPLEEGWHNCPPAPRIGSGSFESSFWLNTPVDSSIGNSGDNHDRVFHASTSLQRPLGPKDSKYSRAERRRAETLPTHEDPDTLEKRNDICTFPQTPLPGTKLWSSGTESVAPISHWSLNLEKKQAIWCSLQLHSITPSVSVKPNLSKRLVSNSKIKSAEQLAPDTPTRIVKWNLGLGLTLDDITEPDGCGASIGELSVEFAEDSFFNLDTDSEYCSTADTTLNTTIETIPDMALPCLRSPVGSATRDLGPELGNTPQPRMWSLQCHHENVKRQRGQTFTTSSPGTRLAYRTGFPSEIDIACLVGRLRVREHGGFCTLLNGTAREFVAGECSLNEAQRKSDHHVADAPIFTLLPPIEL
ncbi:unnamed protein product [Rhizoctonia solani]|uniref:Uncharacterized protein n=1 Tax=Rhizoctonia solani TaxID=456999 RepID=A0A8H2WWI3_9AGAM|nr:unnamed protein product [Rhizoctonia solani]